VNLDAFVQLVSIILGFFIGDMIWKLFLRNPFQRCLNRILHLPDEEGS